jgi:ElaB/YqjD/DUF883 family membrane-anchored ribosome-binding protein
MENQTSGSMNRNTANQYKAATDFGTKAMEVVSDTAIQAKEQLSQVATSTEKMIRKYPLASVGAVLGGGIVLGILAHKLFAPEPTVPERLGLNGLFNRARSGLKNML